MKTAVARDKTKRVAVIHNIDFLSRPATAGPDEPLTFEADAEVAQTAAKIAEILRAQGHEVTILQASDSLDHLPAELRRLSIEVVFNLVETLASDASREAELPLLLEALQIPYTGNGPRALHLAHAKDETKKLLAARGIPTPQGLAIHRIGDLSPALVAGLRFPLFVKPARTDGSIGIDQDSIVRDFAALHRRVAWLLEHLPAPALVEEYLPGKEINVAVFPDPFAGHVVPTEIVFDCFPAGHEPIVTYDCKWLPESPEFAAYSRPCRDDLPAELREEILRIARTTFLALGGTSYGRVDMRLDERGRPAVIDVNPNNDLDPEAGLAVAARSAGVEYSDLIAQILAGASLKENHENPSHS